MPDGVAVDCNYSVSSSYKIVQDWRSDPSPWVQELEFPLLYGDRTVGGRAINDITATAGAECVIRFYLASLGETSLSEKQNEELSEYIRAPPFLSSLPPLLLCR
jgi:hypothetical protein